MCSYIYLYALQNKNTSWYFRIYEDLHLTVDMIYSDHLAFG